MLKLMEKTISLAQLEADPEAVAKDMKATGTIAYEIMPGFLWVHRIEPSWAF